MIERLRFYIWQIKESYYRKRHILRVVSTSTGIKLFNPVPFRNPMKIKDETETVQIRPDDLFMGPDYLRDEYTLLGVCITDSPHKSFIQGLLEGKDMTRSEYMNRLVDGRLDARPITLRHMDMSAFRAKSLKNYESVKQGKYDPVYVYKLGNRFFVKDGKHRAAMCSILGVPVRCKVIAPDFSGGITYHVFSMINNNKEFSKHLDFFHSYKIFA